MSLEANYTARLVVDRPGGGKLTLDFEYWSGGNINPASAKHRGVGNEETARGGKRSRTDVTLRRECDAATWAVKDQLEDSSGRDSCTATRQMTDARGTVLGDALVVTGLVGDVNYPDFDLSGDAVGMLEVTVQASV